MPKISKHGGPTYLGRPRAVAVAEPAAEVEVVETSEDLPAEVQVEPGPVVAEPEPVAPQVTAYDSWTLTQLRDECFRRSLSRAGNKDELVARLAESDAAADVADGGTPD